MGPMGTAKSPMQQPKIRRIFGFALIIFTSMNVLITSLYKVSESSIHLIDHSPYQIIA
jgi:hypothetical protein